MSRAVISDVDVLVAPVPGARPTGVDLKYQPIYDEIRAARREAEQDPADLSRWQRVADLAASASARSKDLQLGIWLLECFARLDGYRGTAAGLTLLRRLLADFWASVYPQIDPDDLDPVGYRRALLHWVNDRLPGIVKGAPFTGPNRKYGLLHYEVAQKTGNEKAALLEQGWPDAEAFFQVLHGTPVASLQQALEEVHASVAALQALESEVDRRFDVGGSSPHGDAVSFVHLKHVLVEAQELLERGIKKISPAGAPSSVSGRQAVEEPQPPVPGEGVVPVGTNWLSTADGARDLGDLRSLQAHVMNATSGRDRFLRHLQLAEASLEAGVCSLAYPIFDELARTIDVRKLEEWEEPALLVRVFKGLSSCCAILNRINKEAADRESTVAERIARLESPPA